MTPAVVIETDRLTKQYGSVRGIDKVSIAIERGEVYGFLGPNGAGKTTTIRTLLDLLHPTSGTATLFGLDSCDQSREIRARLGNLPGDFACDSRLTGREFLMFCAEARGMGGLGTASLLAQRFEADLDRRIGELSRGNRQKIGLIQALFHDPELLMLDEPTTGLDPLMQEEFLAVITEYRDRGGTVFCPRTTSTRSSECATGSRSSGRDVSPPWNGLPSCAAARTTTYRSSSTHRSTPRRSAVSPALANFR